MKRRLMRSKATRWLSYLLGLRNVCGLLLRLLIGIAVITVFHIIKTLRNGASSPDLCFLNARD